MVLLPMGGMGISIEPQDMDLLFVENDEGTMDFYIYLSGVWMENDPEMMEWYYTKETFDDLAPLVSGVSADIFTLDSATQSFVANEKATKTLGQYFVPRVTNALSLMAMDDLCYSCTDVKLTLMEGMATVFIDSSYSNGGLAVTGSTGFIIEKDGTVTNVRIVRSVDAELDQEAVRVVSSMPRWTPGKQRGKPVRVSFTLPIDFQLLK